MKLGKYIIWLALLLGCGPAAEVCAQRTHVLLFDVSGSMRERYAKDVRGWLVTPLLSASVFGPSDRVLVRWFHSEKRRNYRADDVYRKYDDTKNDEAILAAVPFAKDANGNDTDMLEGLQLALADVSERQIKGDVFFWMLTDNVEDKGGKKGDARELYQTIKDDEGFRAAYLFPLAQEPDGLPHDEAMVLYLLHYNAARRDLPLAALDNAAQNTGKKIGALPITWFPLVSGIEMDEDEVQANAVAISRTDGELQLPDIAEGVTPAFTLTFPFSSKLRGRTIEKSRLENPTILAEDLPAQVVGEGSGDWETNITPETLTIEAGKNSAISYETPVSRPGFVFRPASFWEGFWNTTSSPVKIAFRFDLAGVETRIDANGLEKVRNMAGIQENLRQGDGTQLRSNTTKMAFRVRYNTLWRRVLVGVLAAALLGVGLAAVFLLTARTTYELVTPQGPVRLAFGLTGRKPIIINGETAAVISKSVGGLSLRTQSGYVIDEGQTALPLSPKQETGFVLVKEGRGYPYTFKPQGASAHNAAPTSYGGGASGGNPWDI